MNSEQNLINKAYLVVYSATIFFFQFFFDLSVAGGFGRDVASAVGTLEAESVEILVAHDVRRGQNLQQSFARNAVERRGEETRMEKHDGAENLSTGGGRVGSFAT